ncbi:MAG: response regulator [Pseudomonadales bacterium]
MRGPMKVLIVDDFSTMRRIIKGLLRDIGYTDIREASDGKEALKELRISKFDFVVTDWNMPNMSGLELLTIIRKEFDSLPVLMVTAEAKRDQIVAAVQAGVNGYVVKPFTAGTLKEKIDKMLKT